jgi:hypothetical protein
MNANLQQILHSIFQHVSEGKKKGTRMNANLEQILNYVFQHVSEGKKYLRPCLAPSCGKPNTSTLAPTPTLAQAPTLFVTPAPITLDAAQLRDQDQAHVVVTKKPNHQQQQKQQQQQEQKQHQQQEQERGPLLQQPHHVLPLNLPPHLPQGCYTPILSTDS